jgi:hypothetical protein
MAAVCPDYVSMPLPFEYRSTLFFGKPWWEYTDSYQYQYQWDDQTHNVSRRIIGLNKSTFSQFRFYDSICDIIGNGIIASEQNIYTNVIGVYGRDGSKQTRLIQADSDIYPEKQKTAYVRLALDGNDARSKFSDILFSPYGSRKIHAENAACTALRDYMKEMYQGDLVVLGDPTVKPYDTCYMSDKFTDMDGEFWVKRVVHEFSMETGFITSISPDLVSVIDDKEALSYMTWWASAAAGMGGYFAGRWFANTLWKTLVRGPMGDLAKRLGHAASGQVMKGVIAKSSTISREQRMILNIICDDPENYTWLTGILAPDQWTTGELATEREAIRKRVEAKIAKSIEGRSAEQLAEMRARLPSATDDMLKKLLKLGEANYVDVGDISAEIERLATSNTDQNFIRNLMDDVWQKSGTDPDLSKTVLAKIKVVMDEVFGTKKDGKVVTIGVLDQFLTNGGPSQLVEEMANAINPKWRSILSKTVSTKTAKETLNAAIAAAKKNPEVINLNLLADIPDDEFIAAVKAAGVAFDPFDDATMKIVDDWAAKLAKSTGRAVTDAQKEIAIKKIKAELLQKAAGEAAENIFTKTAGAIVKPVGWTAKLGAKVAGEFGSRALRGAGKLVKFIGGPVAVAAYVAEAAITLLCGSIAESVSRGLRYRQALVIIPLRYRKKSYVAGIEGHAGAVMGDDPSNLDKMLIGTGWFKGPINAFYTLLGVTAPDYATTNTDAIQAANGGNDRE